ncbi:MAG: hypothetical protein GX455_15875 [Phycisphaerae bacterium]|nr:hypothetical protein [Phycisphaerae bacterium]
MALIGGILSFRNAIQPHDLEELLKRFSILPKDNGAEYETRVWSGPLGCLTAKHKPSAPTQLDYRRDGQWSRLTLGYHDLSFSETTGDGQSHDLPGRIEQSEGEFVCLLMDHETGTVHIINDRFAARPFFLHISPEQIAFSSNLLFLTALAKIAPQPDPLGWMEILTFGHTLDQATTVRGITRIRPGSHITIDAVGIHEKQYWRLRHEPQEDLDPKAFAQETFAAFSEGVAWRARMLGKCFISLSGGLDSRLVAGAAPKDADYFFFTFSNAVGGGETAQVSAARQVAKILGREHQVRAFAPAEFSREADLLIRLTGGMVPLQHPVKNLQSIHEMKQHTGVKLGGGAGDVLAGDFAFYSIHNINPRLTAMQVEKFIGIRRMQTARTLAKIFRRDFVRELYPLADRAMHETFAPLSGPTAAHRTTAWAMTIEETGTTFLGPIHNHPEVHEARPHLGYRFTEHLLRLPAKWIYRKNFYQYMIWLCLPELRSVPYANIGRPLDGILHEWRPSARKRICGRIENLLPTVPLERLRRAMARSRMVGSFEYDLMRSDPNLTTDIREAVASYPELRRIVDPAGCERFLTEFAAGQLHTKSRASEAELIGPLATLAYWHRYFSAGTI